MLELINFCKSIDVTGDNYRIKTPYVSLDISSEKTLSRNKQRNERSRKRLQRGCCSWFQMGTRLMIRLKLRGDYVSGILCRLLWLPKSWMSKPGDSWQVTAGLWLISEILSLKVWRKWRWALWLGPYLILISNSELIYIHFAMINGLSSHRVLRHRAAPSVYSDETKARACRIPILWIRSWSHPLAGAFSLTKCMYRP